MASRIALKSSPCAEIDEQRAAMATTLAIPRFFILSLLLPFLKRYAA
jgi:hypothetical protein